MNFAPPETIILIDFIFVLYCLNDVQEDVGLVFLLLTTNDAPHRNHHLDFVLNRVRGFLLHHSVECVTHNSYKHV